MALERTFSIVKPDAVAKNVIGEIYNRFEKAGLKIVASKMLHLTREQAGEFYAVHKERPFYGELVDFMTSGPVVVQVLEGEGAIAKNREVMGATNLRRPLRVPFVPISPRPWMRMPYTALMHLKPPRWRSNFSSLKASANAAAEVYIVSGREN